MAASQAWELLVPVLETKSDAVAGQVCDVLRAWTWKALDRRRRDPDLKEWVELLNRVEAFYADRFASLASKLEVLADLLHESLAVSELALPEDLLRRKHVLPILNALDHRKGSWVERAQLMDKLGLKAANMTRLMTLLLDMGWVEQETVNGREAAYRISAEGASRATSAESSLAQTRSGLSSALGLLHTKFRSEAISERVFTMGMSTTMFEPHSALHRGHVVDEWEHFVMEPLSAIQSEQDEDHRLEFDEGEDVVAFPVDIFRQTAVAGGARW
ncbi:hypothetical protein U1737_00010 [Sphingomonas sp. LB3N6]|uniref:hypothetical protein n=1 Tax=Sphingomonas fucosidasi TaxID=3096164 RepID=UPI002FCB09C2